MKKTALAILCAAIAATFRAAALTKRQADYFKNRRICVKRDTTTMPGYVITEWHRNGRPDTKGPAVVTNRLQKIVGAEQRNAVQARAESLAARLSAALAECAAVSNRAERAEARRLTVLEWAGRQRDSAVLPSTKALWQSIIDKLSGE